MTNNNINPKQSSSDSEQPRGLISLFYVRDYLVGSVAANFASSTGCVVRAVIFYQCRLCSIAEMTCAYLSKSMAWLYSNGAWDLARILLKERVWH